MRIKKLKNSIKKLKKLTNKYFNLESLEKDEKKKDNISTINNTFSFDDNIYDKIYVNTTNFYDSNYYIPNSKTLRNKQLYNKRLENPKFNTLNKCVYPFWWWNQTEHNYLNTNTAPSYIKNSKLKKIFKNNQNSIHKRSNKKYNYFAMVNKTNYKISYDKNLNVINVETTGERKTKINKI